MGNCMSTLQEGIENIRKGNKVKENHKSDYHQLLLKRILLLEEQTAQQEFTIRMMKMQLSHLEVRRYADKKKIVSLGKSVLKVQETFGQSTGRSALPLKELDCRFLEIEDVLKELQLKIEVHGSMLRELHKKKYHEDEGQLIDVLEQGIKEGKKHLNNLEKLFEPVRLLMESDNSIRQLMKK